MARVEITPRYDLMFDGYVVGVKLAYSEYKNAIVDYLDSTWIGSDGSFNILGKSYLDKKLEEKRTAYEKAMEEMIAFKILYGDKIEELKQTKRS